MRARWTLPLALLVAVASVAVWVAASRSTVPNFSDETPITDAYATLHRLGYRVALRLPRGWKLGDGPMGEAVVRSTTYSGNVATIVPGGPGAYGSEVGLIHAPRVRVPALVGGSAEAAVSWANAHQMWWWVRKLPSLPPSNAPQLYLAYRVTAQSPAGGTTIPETSPMFFTIKPR